MSSSLPYSLKMSLTCEKAEQKLRREKQAFDPILLT